MKKLLALAVALALQIPAFAADINNLVQTAAAASGPARETALNAALDELSSNQILTAAEKLHSLWQLRHLASTDTQKSRLLEIASLVNDNRVRMFIFEFHAISAIKDAYNKAVKTNNELLLNGKPMPAAKDKVPPRQTFGINPLDARETYDSWTTTDTLYGHYASKDGTLTADIVAEPCDNYRARLNATTSSPLDLLAFSNNGTLTFTGPAATATPNKDGTLTVNINGTSTTLAKGTIAKTYFNERPKNATVLLDGNTTDLSKNFRSGKGDPKWKLLPGGIAQSAPGTGSLLTAGSYSDCTLYLEFRVPYNRESMGQHRGNSGIFPMSAYEVQVLDSFGLDPKNNELGGIYKVAAPTRNMAAAPLEWQSYLIRFTAPKFDSAGKKTANARMTVILNGVQVQANTEVPFNTINEKTPEPQKPAPIAIQQHTNPIQFRNIWVLAQ